GVYSLLNPILEPSSQSLMVLEGMPHKRKYHNWKEHTKVSKSGKFEGKKMPEALSNVLWGIAQPCLIASYGLLFVVLRNAIRLKQRFQTWFNTRNITLVVVPHFLFVFTSDLAVSFSPKLKALTFVFGVEAKLFVSSDIKTPRSVLKKNEAQKHSFRSV
ncbi:hypothetical protein QZH41_004778, partial [Actinostola sp. cb2023]